MLSEMIHYLASSIDIVWNALAMLAGFLFALGGYAISGIAAHIVPAICLIVGALLALFVPYFIVVVFLELLNAVTNGFVKKSDKALTGIVLIGAIIFIWFVFSGLLAWANSDSLTGMGLMIVGFGIFLATYAWVEIVMSLRNREQPIDPSTPKSIPAMLAPKN